MHHERRSQNLVMIVTLCYLPSMPSIFITTEIKITQFIVICLCLSTAKVGQFSRYVVEIQKY